jgi:hypothetical protein
MSLQVTSKFNQSQPYHSYLDISVFNNNVNHSAVPLVINQTRLSSYLKAPENYFGSIVFFQLGTASLPVWLCEVQVGQSNVNLSIYSFSLSYGGFTATSPLIYVPEDTTIQPPQIPLTSQDVSNAYYYVYTIQQFIDMINTTLSSAFTSLAGMTALPTAIPPYFTFDVNTSLFTFHGDSAGFNQTLGASIQIYMNNPLLTLLNSFPVKTDINGTYLKITDTHNNIFPNFEGLGYSQIQIYQESTTINFLNPVKSIVFTTSMLPIVPENTNPPLLFGSNSIDAFTSSSNNLSNIITDFHVDVTNLNTYKENVVYEPAVYRLFDMYGSEPLTSYELRVYWQNNYNHLTPFLLSAQTGCSIKIMFRRRDFNTATLFSAV